MTDTKPRACDWETLADGADYYVAEPSSPKVTFSGGKLRFGVTFRGFDLELPVDHDLRMYLLDGGVDEEDAVTIVHVDFARFSWRRHGLRRGSSGVTFFPGLNRGEGLLGAPGATLCRVRTGSEER